MVAVERELPGGGGEITRAEIAAMRADPRFPSAMRHLAEGILETYSGNRLLNRLLSDRGRIVFGILALHFHFYADATGTGLTPTRLVQACEDTGVCSRGRARALLALMRWAGYLEPDLATSDRRKRPLVPTERMLKAYVRRWQLLLEAAAVLAPDDTALPKRADDPDLIRGLVIEMGLAFRNGFRLLDHVPALRQVAEQDGGFYVLLAIALSGPPGGGFPAAVPIGLSISALAARFHVSRAHTLHVLREAEAHGFLRRNGTGPASVICLPPLKAALEDFFATQIAFFTRCARRALNGGADGRHASKSSHGAMDIEARLS